MMRAARKHNSKRLLRYAAVIILVASVAGVIYLQGLVQSLANAKIEAVAVLRQRIELWP